MHVSGIVLPYEVEDPLELLGLERGRKALLLKLVQLGGIEQAVLVDVRDFEYPAQRLEAFRLERVLARVVQRRGRVQDGFLCKVKHLGYVEREQRRALDDSLDFLLD